MRSIKSGVYRHFKGRYDHDTSAQEAAGSVMICTNCGDDIEPGLRAVECLHTGCHANPGTRCKRPSGHGGGPFTNFHVAREKLALQRGTIRRCPGSALQSDSDAPGEDTVQETLSVRQTCCTRSGKRPDALQPALL